MPITFDFEPDHGLVIFRHIGEVPDEELLKFYGDFFNDPKVADYPRLVIYLEQTKSAGRSSTALRSLADLFKEWIQDRQPGIRVAVIASKDHSFGMARMYEAVSSGLPWEFHVFRDGDAALAWLGVFDVS